MVVFGIDEAGKGPVLGPMIAVCVVVPEESVLPDGVDDSKRLAPARREELARAIRTDERITIGVSAIEPSRIDSPETDMNTLTVVAHAEAADGVLREGMEGVCDAGDVDAGRFARRVAKRLPDVELVAEHRADESHPVVAAASVIAKVERDARIEALSAAYGGVGSGYPSDPATREFLASHVAEHGQLPACARASWKTCEDVLRAADQRTLAEF